jgi:plasmid stabilization system protein ParE
VGQVSQIQPHSTNPKMPHLSYTPRSIDDLARFQTFLLSVDYENAAQVIEMIVASINQLSTLPFLGRVAHDDAKYRELINPFGSSGYIALYRYLPDQDLVRILAMKHQKEDDYNKP